MAAKSHICSTSLVGLAMAALLLLSIVPMAGGSPASRQGLSIRLTELSTVKSVKLSDSVILGFKIINSGSSRIGIFSRLGMGYQGGVILHVLRQDGSEMQKPVLFHDTLLESDVMNQNNYTELMPDHFIGMKQTFKVSELVTRPGVYKLMAEYHSPIDSKYAKIDNFFGIEEKSIVSNQVVLIVQP